MNEMTKITWYGLEVNGNAESKPCRRTFTLDSDKTWKGKLLRGYDVAEMICDAYWKNGKDHLTKVRITAPSEYVGEYEVRAEFIPTFFAKRIVVETV